MGEAVYQIRARFVDEKTTVKVEKDLAKLMKQLDKAYNFWQDNRTDGTVKSRAVFWKTFKAKFPLAYEILPHDKRDGDHNNALAGELSFTDTYETPNIERKGTLLTYTAVVWHFADWDSLVKWFLIKGATKCHYVSDEYSDPFEALAAI